MTLADHAPILVRVCRRACCVSKGRQNSQNVTEDGNEHEIAAILQYSNATRRRKKTARADAPPPAAHAGGARAATPSQTHRLRLRIQMGRRPRHLPLGRAQLLTSK